jgi:hypothetical protein
MFIHFQQLKFTTMEENKGAQLTDNQKEGWADKAEDKLQDSDLWDKVKDKFDGDDSPAEKNPGN